MKAFTLIELLAVLIILGVILAIIIPVTNGVINNSRQNAYDTQIDLLKDQALKYSINNDLGTEDGVTKSLQFNQLLTAGIISELPQNPITSEQLEGCILYTWKSEIKQYVFEYSEDCKVPEIAKNPMISGTNFNAIFKALPEYNNITSIVFEGTIDSNVDVNTAIDLSLNQDKSILGYVDNTTFRIQTNGIVLAHQNLGGGWNPETTSIDVGMFEDLEKITTINFKDNTRNIFDTSQTTNMSAMFFSTQTTNLDLSGFDTSNVIDMSNMFIYSKLQSVNLTSFNTTKVTTMHSMFFESTSLQNLNLSNFDFTNVEMNWLMFCNIPNNETLAEEYFGLNTDNYYFAIACNSG